MWCLIVCSLFFFVVAINGLFNPFCMPSLLSGGNNAGIFYIGNVQANRQNSKKYILKHRHTRISIFEIERRVCVPECLNIFREHGLHAMERKYSNHHWLMKPRANSNTCSPLDLTNRCALVYCTPINVTMYTCTAIKLRWIVWVDKISNTNWCLGNIE